LAQVKRWAPRVRDFPGEAMAVGAWLIALSVLAPLRQVAARRPFLRATKHLEAYSYAQFLRDFGRDFEASGSNEYRRREALFEVSLKEVRETNTRNRREGRAWTAGVHAFMDWTPAERRALHGYKPARRSSQALAATMTGLQLRTAGAEAAARANSSALLRGINIDEGTARGDGSIGTQVAHRNQGNCGSCWAISAVEAVEARLPGTAGGDFAPRVSAQALVDCVPNPQHCGGSGGCEGATGELAYAFMRDNGIPLESDMPYLGQAKTCQATAAGEALPSQRRVRVSGWHALPSNKAEPLMRALVEQGPVVVAVDADNWFNYDSGIFDDCARDAVLGHAVLAKGYGEDAGRKYWLIQNSWGAEWGENGDIRIKRHDDEGAFCGIDRKPQEGVGCDGGPAEVEVCGMCGLLYDPIFPEGVRIEGGDAAAHVQNSELAIARQAPFGSDSDAVEEMQALLNIRHS